ncbi:MAG TPA: helix-turn-helix domain-containing protein [Devosia sp.]
MPDGFDLDEVLRALSHADRRRFVMACLDEAKAAGELAGLSELSLATVSEHLKVLRKSGLLILDRSGRFWLYRTDRAVLERAGREVLAMLDSR